MRVDSTGNLKTGGLGEGRIAGKAASAGGSARSAVGGAVEAGRSAYLGYVQRAAAMPEVDAAKVAAASDLLASGKLDTPEAVLRAARSILSRL